MGRVLALLAVLSLMLGLCGCLGMSEGESGGLDSETDAVTGF